MSTTARIAGQSASDEPHALYAGVKQMIATKIRSGEWAAGFRLPSESELVRAMGVSRMTANRALRELSIEGLIVRVQGVGSFVAEAKPFADLLEVRNIAEEIVQRGHIYSARVIIAAVEVASPEIADALSVPLSSDVFHTLIVHHENDVPVQLEDRFVNPAAAPDYLECDFTTLTPNAALSSSAPLSEAEHIVEAVLAAPWESRLLAVSSAEPCLLIRRRTWSGGLTVTAARLLYPGGRYRLRGRHEAAI